ncbi:MAG: hypothetical protein K6G00_03625 [Treponema sp.]|nr:hypothetical protein [Treponema sp.]
MNGKKSHALIYVLVFILTALLVGAVFIGLKLRTSHYEGASISSELDLIDSDIKQGNHAHAIASLRKIEKRSLGIYERIGIYKRYMMLSETKRAERCLIKALRRFPKNLELTALYGNFLLRHDKAEEALSKTEILLDSEYSSVYAEAFLRHARSLQYDADSLFSPKKSIFSFLTKKNKVSAGQDFEYQLFTDNRFIPIYKAASHSGMSMWLINAASLLMHSGDYASAADMYVPLGENSNAANFSPSYHDALFWGIVFYDAGRFAESLSALQSADNLDASSDMASAIELKALESDNYYILDDNKTAQAMRREILEVYSPYMNAFMADNVPALKSILPIMFMNTAIYARDSGDLVEQYDKLYELVNYYPSYGPGLAAFAEYAIESKRRPEEEELDQQLRAAGLRTVAMEERDLIPVVELEDVVSLIDRALEENKVPELIVLKEIVNSEHIKKETRDVKASKVWKLLEENEISACLYPSEIMHYALVVLIKNGDLQNAQRLFWDYLRAAYPDEDMKKMSLWECEMAAYFSAERQEYNAARSYYEHVLDYYSKIIPVTNTAGQNDSLTNSYVNLANIYAGYNKSPQALDLLNKASARVTEKMLKSEILYRIAEECLSMGNEKDALRSLQYSISLNPSNSKARLMIKQLRQAK